MSASESVTNFGAAILRRVLSAHKPLIRLARRTSRERQQQSFRRDAEAVDREIAAVASGRGPIVVGPWLAEVGYEALYWVPFVRWFQDRFGIPPDRLHVLSRGGVDAWYSGVAGHYVDIFDLMAPEELAERNAARRSEDERGGQKQSTLSALDQVLLTRFAERTGCDISAVCHPSLMFNVFRHVWHHNLAFDFLWRRTRYERVALPAVPLPGLPSAPYTAVKLYSGMAIPPSDENRRALASLVRRAAATSPVVLLDADVPFDEHLNIEVGALPNVVSARSAMTPRNNLGIQSAVVAGASQFIGTCGGLAWLAPMLGVPTVAVYEDDRLLDVHMMVARQVYKRIKAAPFTHVDLRAWRLLGME